MSNKIRMERESVQRTMGKRGLTWIHVSDWHQRGREFDRAVVRDALIEDIKNRTAISVDLATIDFIVFSGDLAYSGRIEEYLAAKEQFLDPLVEACGLSHDRLFIVPGNHDLDRQAIDLILKGVLTLFKSYDDVKSWLTQENYRAMLMRPFQAFKNFIADCTGKKQGDYASICMWNNISGKKIALLGLNSAWACGRHKNSLGEFDDKGFVFIGEPQIYDSLRLISEADIKIAVLHHPFEWFNELDRDCVERRLINGCDFILQGHQHKPNVAEIRNTSGNCIIIPAGACYDRRASNNQQYYNSYNLTHLDFDYGTGSVFLRRWSEKKNKWVKDIDSYDEGKFSFNIPKLMAKGSPDPFDVGQYLDELERRYYDSRIDEWYEPLEGFLDDESGQPKNIDVDQYINSWIEDKSKHHLALLGDYGTGKSWLCLRLAQHLAEEYRKTSGLTTLPLLISFRYYRPKMDINELIKEELFNGYGVEIKNPVVLRRHLLSGKILLILDGLDEMVRELGERTAAIVAYLRLGIVSEIPKIIITCRTHFFYSGSEEREFLRPHQRIVLQSSIPQFDILHLSLLDRNKIINYIRRRFGNSNGTEILQFVDSKYNMFELCSRPVLLSLMCETYDPVVGFKDASSSVDLYEAYIDSWLDPEYKSGRLIVEPYKVKEFFENLASYMINGNTLIINADNLREILSAFLEKLGFSQSFLKDIERQFITSTFIQRVSSDVWQFSHKSFAEFFYARKFFRWECETGGEGTFAVLQVPIWQFISQMALDRWNKQKALKWIPPIIKRDLDPTLTKTTLRAAAAYWLLKKGLNPRDYPLSGIMLDYMDLKYLDLRGCDLSNADFQHSNMYGAKLSYSNLNGSILTETNLQHADLQGATLKNCEISKADFRGAFFGEAQSNELKEVFTQLKGCSGYETALFDDEIIQKL